MKREEIEKLKEFDRLTDLVVNNSISKTESERLHFLEREVLGTDWTMKLIDHVEKLEAALEMAEGELIKTKKLLDINMSTFSLVKKHALKHANRCKPPELDTYSWSKSKERKLIYNSFIIGAKCEHQWNKVGNENLKLSFELAKETLIKIKDQENIYSEGCECDEEAISCLSEISKIKGEV